MKFLNSYGPFILAALATALLILIFLRFDSTCHAPTIDVPAAAVPATPPPAPVPAHQGAIAPTKSLTEVTSRSAESGSTGLALLTAEWCGPCQRLKREVLPDLDELDIAIVDVDAAPDLAQKLFKPGDQSIPQFVRFQGAAGELGLTTNVTGWLTGFQDAEKVKSFAAGEPHEQRAKPTAANDCDKAPASCSRTFGRWRRGR